MPLEITCLIFCPLQFHPTPFLIGAGYCHKPSVIIFCGLIPFDCIIAFLKTILASLSKRVWLICHAITCFDSLQRTIQSQYSAFLILKYVSSICHVPVTIALSSIECFALSTHCLIVS